MSWKINGWADILHKLAMVEEEAGESLYWLELLNDIKEIVAMTVSSIKTLRLKNQPIQNLKSKI